MSLHDESNRIIDKALADSSGSYQVNVSHKGKFLFRTDEQPVGFLENDMEKCLKHLVSRFTKADGYEVQVVMWPSKAGIIKDVTQ